MFMFKDGTTDLNDSCTPSCPSKLLIPKKEGQNGCLFLCSVETKAQKPYVLPAVLRKNEKWLLNIVWCGVRCLASVYKYYLRHLFLFPFFRRLLHYNVPKEAFMNVCFVAFAPLLCDSESKLQILECRCSGCGFPFTSSFERTSEHVHDLNSCRQCERFRSFTVMMSHCPVQEPREI